MEERTALLQRALSRKVIAIVRLRHPAPLLDLAAALIEGGITALEFTLNTPGALDAIERCRTRYGGDAVIGAGTVLNGSEARRSLDAGAQFLVSPGFDREVLEAARAGGALSMPGAMTPTEIVTAWRAGADVVKVFPARSLGPRYISDLLGPLADVPLMPTGGVDEKNAGEYLRAGAVAVAVGGNLVDAATISRSDWATLTARARALLDAVHVAPPD